MMSVRWPGRSGRRAEPSRPQVTRAVEAARMAQAGVAAGLGSASAQGSVSWQFDVVERAATTGPLKKAMRRAKRGLTPQLLWATARAAQQAGRQPEEVWAEALRNWLALQETTQAAVALRPRGLESRRQVLWHDIEDTLRALRVS